jgi:REP-associated tyrosine transposase
MARQSCPQQPGVPLHLVLRGEPTAATPAEILELLRGASAAADCAVHAYVLMGTHAHLLLTPLRADAAAPFVRALGAPEFDASPVYARRHVLACMRYIEMNPVGAGLVRHPAHYRWSSYRANALGEADALVTPHALYCALGRSADERRAAYRGTFRDALRTRAPPPAC